MPSADHFCVGLPQEVHLYHRVDGNEAFDRRDVANVMGPPDRCKPHARLIGNKVVERSRAPGNARCNSPVARGEGARLFKSEERIGNGSCVKRQIMLLEETGEYALNAADADFEGVAVLNQCCQMASDDPERGVDRVVAASERQDASTT